MRCFPMDKEGHLEQTKYFQGALCIKAFSVVTVAQSIIQPSQLFHFLFLLLVTLTCILLTSVHFTIVHADCENY